MSIKSPIKKNTDFEIAPAGNHVARLYSVVHIGTIKEMYMGDEKMVDKVRLTFELPEELRDFGGTDKPIVISQEFTNSMHEKANLGKLVRGMLGTSWNPNEDTEEMDIVPMVGTACMVNIIHKTAKQSGNVRAEILSAAPLPKGIEAKSQVNPSYVLDYEENWSEAKFEKLPDFLKEKIKSSQQYREKILGEVIESEEDNGFSGSGADSSAQDGQEINPADIPF